MTPSLRTDQVADLAWIMATPKAGLLHEPACGKTPTVCVYMEWVWREFGKPSIWVMPKTLIQKNFDELVRFTNLRAHQIAIVDGPNWKKELARPGIVVYLMGPTRFRLSSKSLPKVEAVVADEPHKYWTTNKSASCQSLYQFMRHTPRFVPMTGTLIAGRLDSAYPIIHVIEPRHYGSYQGFLNEHAILDDYGTVVAWRNPQKLVSVLSRYCVRRTFESIHGKEAKLIINELCDMSPKQRAAYDEFAANALLELEDRFLTGATGGVHAIRCRQIMAHPETFGIDAGTPTGKDDRLDIHLSDHLNSGKPLVIFASLVPEQERILRQVRAMGMTAAIINGTVTGTKRTDAEKAFREGKIQVMVCSPIVADVGFNWGHVDTMIFASLDYLDTTFSQAYKRAIRGPRSTPLLIYVLEYRDSIDQRIFQIIERKSKLAASVDHTREVFELSANSSD